MGLLGPQRYSRVPWLAQSDLEPFGDPETLVELGVNDVTQGLAVRYPFGPDTDAMIAIHANRVTGQITLAITAMVTVDNVPYAQRRRYEPYLDARQQGRDRSPRSQGDGHSDEDEA